eukprot:6203940-Pleurochrysis_carterae.AAC.1
MQALGGLWRPGRFKGYVIEPYEEALRGAPRSIRSVRLASERARASCSIQTRKCELHVCERSEREPRVCGLRST